MPCRSQITVLAPKMNTVGTDLACQPKVIVDDQGHPGRPAQAQQGTGLDTTLRTLNTFVAVLQQGRPTLQHTLDLCKQACIVFVVGGDRIQAAQRPR